MRCLALTVPLLASACVVGGGKTTYAFADATAVRVTLGNGSVQVAPGASEVTVDWEGGGVGTAGIPRCDQTDDGLVTVDAEGAFGGGEVWLSVPDGVNVAVFVDRGDLDLRLEAPADVVGCVGAGDAAITVPAGRYDLHLEGGVGDVDIDGIEDDPTSPYHLGACVGAGSLTIRGR